MLVFLEAEAFRLHTRPHISLAPGRSVSGTWAILQLRNHRHRGRRLTRNRSNINKRKFHNRPSARTDCTFKVTTRPKDLFTSRAAQVLLRLFSLFFSFCFSPNPPHYPKPLEFIFFKLNNSLNIPGWSVTNQSFTAPVWSFNAKWSFTAWLKFY